MTQEIRALLQAIEVHLEHKAVHVHGIRARKIESLLEAIRNALAQDGER
jgi:hypothetical protein